MKDKKLINQIITQLLIFRYQLKQYNAFVKGVVEVYGSSPEAEKERQRIMEKHYITGDDIGKSFSDIFDKVSAFDRILAVSIGHKVTRMKKIKDEKLNSVYILPPIYETLLNVTTCV